MTNSASGRPLVFLFGLALVLLVLVGLREAWWYRQTQEVESAVRAVLEEQVAAWNQGDLDRFMETYWNSDELRFYSGGNVEEGWQATMDRYQKRYRAKGQEMGKLTFSDLDVQVFGPDAAVARARWRLVRSRDSPGGLFTLVLRRLPEGWRIVHDHTSAEEKKKPS